MDHGFFLLDTLCRVWAARVPCHMISPPITKSVAAATPTHIILQPITNLDELVKYILISDWRYCSSSLNLTPIYMISQLITTLKEVVILLGD